MSLRPWAALFAIACAQPTAGTYTFTVTSTESDCPAGFLPSEEPTGDGTIALGEGALVFTDEDTDVAASCPLTGMDFTCDFAETDGDTDYTKDGFAAVRSVDELMKGTFDEPSAAHGLTSLNSSCGGTGCDELAAAGYPSCLATWYWSAVLAE